MINKNNETNLKVVEEIALALEELNDEVVFVGGAVVSIYANETAAEDARVTKDIDITLQLATYGDLAKITGELGNKKFYPEPEGGVICRFSYNGILVDVMSTIPVGWAPANKWFKPGFEHLEMVVLNKVQIRILSVAYFLATKFEAYHSRGKDPRTSYDFEDIVYILNNRATLVEDIENSPEDVKEYLISEFRKIVNNAQFQEAVLVHLPFELQNEQNKILMEKLKIIVNVK